MVLLHYLVVPGLGDDAGSRSRATAVPDGDTAQAACNEVTVTAVLNDPATPFAA